MSRKTYSGYRKGQPKAMKGIEIRCPNCRGRGKDPRWHGRTCARCKGLRVVMT